MSALLTRKAIVRQVSQNYVETPVMYSNDETKIDTKNPFVKLEIEYTKSESRWKGSIDTRQIGIIFMTVYVPVLSGENRMYEIVDKIEEALEHKRFDGIVTRNASRIVNRNKAEHYSLTVSIPFLET